MRETGFKICARFNCVTDDDLMFFFFFNDTATTEIYTLSLHDALPIFCLGTEGSNGSLFRNGWFQWFSVWELKVPMVAYLEMGGSNGFLFRN